MIEHLSHREQQVLHLMADGHTDWEIGARLNIAASTVKTYKRNIFEALGARNAIHAVSLAYQQGYLSDGAIDDLAVVRQARDMGYRLALVRLNPGPETGSPTRRRA